MLRRPPASVAALLCLCWLALATGFGAHSASAAEPSDPIDLGGQPLPGGDQGSADPTRPIALEPGLWQATLPGANEQHFTYERRIQDSRVHVGVIGAPQDDEDEISVETFVGEGGDETTCGEENSSAEIGYPHAVLGADVIVGDEDEATCRSADTVRIEVGRGSSTPSSDLPYVIKVVEEAPASGDDGESDDEPPYDLPEPATARDVAGAASFDDAPLLDASSGATTVKATVTEGTEVLWRVAVGWGEQPVVRVDVPAAEDSETFPSYGGAELSVNLVNPMRGRFRYVDSSRDESGTGAYRAADDDESGGETLAASGYPVTRADGMLPGDYWIALAVQPPDDDRSPEDIPVEVTVELQGEPDDGPSYNKAVLSQGNDAGPAGYSPGKPFLVADGRFAAVASGNPRAVEDDDEAWLTGRRWTGLALGVVSALCLGAGALRLRARR